MFYSKNHQRALESVQASLEAESRGKAEAMRAKKKLENDINDLEMAADGANRARAEAEKVIKKYQAQVEVQKNLRVFFKIFFDTKNVLEWRAPEFLVYAQNSNHFKEY